jgi:selenocysteine-specific elongation factor
VQKLDVVKVACPSATGFAELKNRLKELLSEAVQREASSQSVPVYLPIDRVFSKSGYGIVITGTLVRGTVKVGDSLFIEPGGLKPRVRGLETFGKSLETALPGQRLAINLTFKEHTTLTRGQTILGEELPPCNTLVVQLTRTSDTEDGALGEALAGQPARLYHGTAECPGDIRWVEQLSAGGSEKILTQLSLNEPVVAEPGDRFVLRYGDEGITGGIILANARPRWLTRPKLLDLATSLLQEDYRAAVGLFLDACSQRTVRQDTLNTIVPRSLRESLLKKMVEDGTVVRLANYLATKESMELLSGKVLRELSQLAPDGDDDKRGALETLRGRVLPGIDRAAFQALIKHLTDSGQVVRKGDRLVLPSAETARQEKPQSLTLLEGKLVDILSQHPCLEIEELIKQSGQDKKAVTAALNNLAKEQRASVVNYEFASLNSKLDDAHKLLADIWQKKKEITPADFRDAIGTTRKYAMAMLAYFDDHGVTRRLANSRVLLKNPKRD